MKKNGGKISGAILFLLLVSGLFYLTFFQVNKTQKGEIKMIVVTGNNLLSESDYLSFTRLNDISKYAGIRLSVIKDRFEKHPYVENADVELNGDRTVIVKITEKKIAGVLLSGKEPNLITGKFQVLPLLPDTKFIDLPVISNIRDDDKIIPMKFIKNKDIIQAFRIIEAAKLTNTDILRKLSEINLRKGGDVVLTFSGIKPPVIYGRGEDAKKMVYLDIMWEQINNVTNLSTQSDYIDLRFANEIFVGNIENTGLSE